MASAYTADGKRKSSQTHANRGWTCPCGRTVHGNGGKSSHRKACLTYKRGRYVSIGRSLLNGTWAALPYHQRSAEEDFERLRRDLLGIPVERCDSCGGDVLTDARRAVDDKVYCGDYCANWVERYGSWP